jgi:hypothetical protein
MRIQKKDRCQATLTNMLLMQNQGVDHLVILHQLHDLRVKGQQPVLWLCREDLSMCYTLVWHPAHNHCCPPTLLLTRVYTHSTADQHQLPHTQRELNICDITDHVLTVQPTLKACQWSHRVSLPCSPSGLSMFTLLLNTVRTNKLLLSKS